jgi:hypothetical protein
MAAPLQGMCCGQCAYFEAVAEEHGECRRYAPHPNSSSYVPKVDSVGQIKFDIHWPKVYRDNWCGQFASRKKAMTQAAAEPKEE